jgi:hypothetical protein
LSSRAQCIHCAARAPGPQKSTTRTSKSSALLGPETPLWKDTYGSCIDEYLLPKISLHPTHMPRATLHCASDIRSARPPKNMRKCTNKKPRRRPHHRTPAGLLAIVSRASLRGLLVPAALQHPRNRASANQLANYETRRCSRTMLFETPCLGVGLIPVLKFSRLHVLEVDLVVAEASADSAGDGSD